MECPGLSIGHFFPFVLVLQLGFLLTITQEQIMPSSRTRVTKTVTVRRDSPVPRKRTNTKKSSAAVIAVVLAIAPGLIALKSKQHGAPHVRAAAAVR